MRLDASGRGMVAFEDNDVIFGEFGEGAAGADDAEGEVVEAGADEEERREELEGEFVEDLDEDLVRLLGRLGVHWSTRGVLTSLGSFNRLDSPLSLPTSMSTLQRILSGFVEQCL